MRMAGAGIAEGRDAWCLDRRLRIHPEVDEIHYQLHHRLRLNVVTRCPIWREDLSILHDHARTRGQAGALPGGDGARMARIEPRLTTAPGNDKAQPGNDRRVRHTIARRCGERIALRIHDTDVARVRRHHCLEWAWRLVWCAFALYVPILVRPW